MVVISLAVYKNVCRLLTVRMLQDLWGVTSAQLSAGLCPKPENPSGEELSCLWQRHINKEICV